MALAPAVSVTLASTAATIARSWRQLVTVSAPLDGRACRGGAHAGATSCPSGFGVVNRAAVSGVARRSQRVEPGTQESSRPVDRGRRRTSLQLRTYGDHTQLPRTCQPWTAQRSDWSETCGPARRLSHPTRTRRGPTHGPARIHGSRDAEDAQADDRWARRTRLKFRRAQIQRRRGPNDQRRAGHRARTRERGGM
jgi:hypothetical protein